MNNLIQQARIHIEKMNNKDITVNIKDKVILITGGTGSFGNTIVKTLLKYKPRRIIIFSRDEKKQFDMRNAYDSSILRFVIGDIREKERLDTITSGVNYIFHAAALKQVPTGEFFPIEVVKTNTMGTNNVIETAIKNKVERVVVLSTDKAVYPINAMGMSKALMEKVMIAAARRINETDNNSTILCGVRYGNVMYSRGSVIPYFVGLIKQKKPLQVTDFLMTRFLLPLSDSVDLVLYALTQGENGYIYIRKSPSCTLETLAKALCDLFNHKPGYIEVGIRAGEKLHETLVSKEEIFRAINAGNYYKIPPETQDLDYNRYFFKGSKVNEQLEPYTSANTKILDVQETKKLLLSLPEIQVELKRLKLKHPYGEEHEIYTILDH